ncbi:MAG: aromatic amino acid transport family protein [Nostocaceae cyanobacterium]|nr:aromatic amino acid transport family protein [Nostocaceae cyanobacterium]
MNTVLKSHTPKVTRLFSNLELDRDHFSHQPGSILGSTALVAGTTVGAGVLALPAVTMPSGVVPSTVGLIAVWLYTLISGLLIAEVSLNKMRITGSPSNGLLGMVESTLGKLGARIAGGAYLFLHYALLVAYIAQGGGILVSAIEQVWGVQHFLPAWLGTTMFTLLFGGIMYLGQEKFVQKLNSVFVGIVIVSFIGLLLLAANQVNPAQFLVQDWTALGGAVSVMLVALFYHNIIPVVVTQLEGDARKVRKSIVLGSVIPLIMFLAWNAVILGSISADMFQGISDGNAVFDPLEILRGGSGGRWLGVLLSVFSEFAIATSFIGFVYGLLDFLKDTNRRVSNQPSQRLPLYCLIFLPAMSLGTINPHIFLTALDYAGTFSISVLGGIIPALMTWKQREENRYSHSIQPLVPGGKLTLIVMITVALAIIIHGG